MPDARVRIGIEAFTGSVERPRSKKRISTASSLHLGANTNFSSSSKQSERAAEREYRKRDAGEKRSQSNEYREATIGARQLFEAVAAELHEQEKEGRTRRYELRKEIAAEITAENAATKRSSGGSDYNKRYT